MLAIYCIQSPFQTETPMTIKMFHPYTQPATESPCRLRLLRCSHLCLASPQVPHLLPPTQAPHQPLSTTQAAHLSPPPPTSLLPHPPLPNRAEKRRRGVQGYEVDSARVAQSRCMCPSGMLLADNEATCLGSGILHHSDHNAKYFFSS